MHRLEWQPSAGVPSCERNEETEKNSSRQDKDKGEGWLKLGEKFWVPELLGDA